MPALRVEKFQAFTLSGNEITDPVRAASRLWTTTSTGGMTDGRLNDSSIGIRRAATNLHRRGQCDAAGADWIADGAGASIAIDATTPPPFSTQSFKVTADGTAASQGGDATTATGLAVAAGVVGVGSIYFKGVAGAAYQVRMLWNNTDATTTAGVFTNVTATGAWQQIAPAALAVAVGKTGDRLRIQVLINGTRAETFNLAHAMIETGQSVVAPYVATAGGATATHPVGRVRAPAALLSPSQWWVAQRIRVSALGTLDTTKFPTFLTVGPANTDYFMSYYNPSTKKIASKVVVGGVAQIDSAIGSPVWNPAEGEFATITVAVAGGAMKVSFNGGAFWSNAFAAGPASLGTLFDIGSWFGGANNALNGDVAAAVGGTGTLTTADALELHTRLAAQPEPRHLANLAGFTA